MTSTQEKWLASLLAFTSGVLLAMLIFGHRTHNVVIYICTGHPSAIKCSVKP